MQSNSNEGKLWRIDIKARSQGLPHRIELGNPIVADPKICGGQPTFKGTRIMVWIVLEQLGEGLTWDEIRDEGLGKSLARPSLRQLLLQAS